MKTRIKTLVGMAIMIALYVILTRFAVNAGPIKITLSGIAIIIGAILYGPIKGMTIGLIGAFIEQLLSGYGITLTTVLWILPAGARGLIVGAILKDKKTKENITFVMLSIILSSIVVTLLNTFTMYVDSKIYNYYSYAYVFGSFLSRIILSIVTAIVYSILTPIIMLSFNIRLKKKNKNKERDAKMTTLENKRSLFKLDSRTRRLYVIRTNRDQSKRIVRRANH